MGVLNTAATQIASHDDLIKPKFTRFRGDGWQIMVTSPQYSLKYAVHLFAALRATNLNLDTRMSIGIGSVRSTGTNTLADADGDAFVLSGGNLDQIGKRRLTVARAPSGPFPGSYFAMLEDIMFGWTTAQAQAIALALRSPNTTQDDIAKTLGITRQAVQLRLAGAHHATIDWVLSDFAKAYLTND